MNGGINDCTTGRARKGGGSGEKGRGAVLNYYSRNSLFRNRDGVGNFSLAIGTSRHGSRTRYSTRVQKGGGSLGLWGRATGDCGVGCAEELIVDLVCDLFLLRLPYMAVRLMPRRGN